MNPTPAATEPRERAATADPEAVLSDWAQARLAGRTANHVDPAASTAIKRTQHEIEISATASAFAAAFIAVMRDEKTYGLIDVQRAPDRVGKEFVLGERFHGRVRLARVAERWRRAGGGWRVAAGALAALGKTALGARLEDAAMSDYAEIEELELHPAPGQPYKMTYRYLSGSPIAGASTFTIEPLGAASCRFRAQMEFQELGGLAIEALHRFGIQMHDQVTHHQVSRAAARCHARILRSTIPAAYTEK